MTAVPIRPKDATAATVIGDNDVITIDGAAGVRALPYSLFRTQIIGGLSGGLTYRGVIAAEDLPATSTAAGEYYLISEAGDAQGKTWYVGDQAIYRGTSGEWDKLNGFDRGIDIRDFGATANSGADSIDAIEAAIVAAAAAKKRVFIPGGYFAISRKLLINVELVGLYGEGPLKSVIQYTGEDDIDAAVEIRGSTYPLYGYSMNISDFGVQGNIHCETALKLSRIAHCSASRIQVGGATDQFLLVDGGVLCHFYDINASAQFGLGLWAGVVPLHGIKITAIDTDAAFSNSLDWYGFICEASSSYGLVLDTGTCQCTLNCGTVENCGLGIQLADRCAGNTFTSVDCEVNVGNDLEVDATCSGNTFTSCLFLTGIKVESYGNVFIAGRAGHILLTATAINNTLIGTVYNSNPATTAGTFTDLGFENSYIGLLNGFTAERLTKLSTVSSAISKSPLTVIHSDGDDDYNVTLESRVVSSGIVNYDVARKNSTSQQTCLTLGYGGQVSFGFPDIIESDARVSIDGGLNIGGTSNPGTGRIRASLTPQAADNAAALLAGLAAGDFYRTGDTLKIVH
ncbi:MAG TPA: glycosyl hydrolase family 28-related protein [Verrucomicrobiae bacterium]|nr:glycosyl hydrolase family 28-related protein [Verrucomicrobiae bacterium]